jgi:hypothetical protein
MATPIKAAPRATVEQAITFAKNSNPLIGAEVMGYLRELWRVCARAGLDPAVLAAQSAYETAEPGRGPWESEQWGRKRNPAGIGVGDVSDVGIVYRSGRDAARAHTLHMAGYVYGANPPGELLSFKQLDPRWDALMASGMAGTVRNVEDLGSGKWATQDKAIYSANILSYLSKITGSAIPAPPEEGPKVPADPKSLLPPIQWEGSPNYHARGIKPVAMVHHCTDDLRYWATESWFQNPDSNASSNFVIERDGTVHQFVSTLNAPWTNGDVRSPRKDIPWLNAAIASGRNLNSYTVTIEYVATPTTPPTEAQYQAGIKLARYCGHPEVYGIPPHRGWQLRHADINSVSRPYCPGPQFDLARVIRALGGDPARLR